MLGVSTMFVCDYDEDVHFESLRRYLIELQDFECSLDPRMPSGADIVDDYIQHTLNQCKKCHGKVLSAKIGDEVVGFATILTKVKSEELDEGDLEYGLVSDLFVAKKCRKQGLGRMLMEEAENYARANNVKWLRRGVLAGNQSADRFYESMGFKSRYIEREKCLR